MQTLLIVLIFIQSLTYLCYEYKPSISRKILERFENKPTKELFKVWHLLYNKKYDLSSEEASKRFKIFSDNLKNINEFNEKSESYRQGMGPFTDVTDEEFKEMYKIHPELQKKLQAHKNRFYVTPNFIPINDDDDDLTTRMLDDCPKSDWRSTLPPIKDQGSSCVAGWAIATATLVEKNYFDKKNSVKAFSAQFFLDCDTLDYGCTNGDPMTALIFLQSQNGLPTESSYPYTGQVGTCQQSTDVYQYQGSIYGVSDVDVGNHIKNKGILTAMTDPTYLKNYQGGLFYDNGNMNYHVHGVIIVGMGCEGTEYYYIVRNSWGTGWGENGYLRFVYKSSTHTIPTPFIAIIFPNFAILE